MKQTNRNMENQKWVKMSICKTDAFFCPPSTNIQGELSAQPLYNKLGLQVWCTELSGGYVLGSDDPRHAQHIKPTVLSAS